jgi:Protein of unknown function (DUF1579)
LKTLGVWMAMSSLVWLADAQESNHPLKPGKEHEALRQFEGRWDALSANTHDGKTIESRGSEVDKVAYGGFWVVMEYSSEIQGKPFSGQGTIGYDPLKKKYLMTWIDNMSPSAMWAQGDADASGKIFTFTSEGFCPEVGKITTFRTVFAFQTADHRTRTFHRPGKDGTEEKAGVIHYTRQS